MPDFEDNKGFKMPGTSIHKGTQKHTNALEAKRAASVKSQSAGCGCEDNKPSCDCGNPPSKFLMKAAGMFIGANKRRQASKDAAEAKKGEGVDKAMSQKIEKF